MERRTRDASAGVRACSFFATQSEFVSRRGRMPRVDPATCGMMRALAGWVANSVESAMADELDLKHAYETPHLTIIGTFEQVTQATNVGTRLDATMPAGTPLTVVLEHLS